MPTVLKYWPVLMGTVALVGSLIGGVRSLQSQRDTLLKVIEQQCQRIDTLERITVQEHPAYSPTMYYLHAPTC